MVRHHLEAEVVVAEEAEGAGAVRIQCYSVGVQAEGQVFQAVAAEAQLADQREEVEAEVEVVQLVQLK